MAARVPLRPVATGARTAQAAHWHQSVCAELFEGQSGGKKPLVLKFTEPQVGPGWADPRSGMFSER
jgi:hypothetical protein